MNGFVKRVENRVSGSVLAGYGLYVFEVPGVDVAIYSRDPQRRLAILHASSQYLPPSRGDLGSGLVERLGALDWFLVLFEQEPRATASALYKRSSVPWPLSSFEFSPQKLRRFIAGQSGAQWFFSAAGRAFMLYVVVGSHLYRSQVVSEVNDFLRNVRIEGGWRLS